MGSEFTLDKESSDPSSWFSPFIDVEVPSLESNSSFEEEILTTILKKTEDYFGTHHHNIGFTLIYTVLMYELNQRWSARVPFDPRVLFGGASMILVLVLFLRLVGPCMIVLHSLSLIQPWMWIERIYLWNGFYVT